MIGSVSIEGEELKLFLWGAKKRSVERYDGSPDNHIEVIAYTKEGQMFHFGSLELFPYPKKLKYGFVVLRNSISYTLNKVLININNDARVKEAILSTGQYDFRINFGKKVDEIEWPIGDILNSNQKTNVSFSAVVLQDDIGEAVVFQNNRRNSDSTTVPLPKVSLLTLDEDINLMKVGNEVVALTDIPCHYPILTGGKGSSLASLNSIKNLVSPSYAVANAIVVTTLAYENFSTDHKFKEMVTTLENVIWDKNSTNQDREKICEKVSSAIGLLTLTTHTRELIERKLKSACGSDYRAKRFAVRSSASGEDCEDMSAAGQMKTFLGLVGLDRIAEAVVQCWASQFSFTAVQYKRQNGQDLNTPMAVVIQEMVAAETAGVLFTCDPVTGYMDKLTLTCNYGIGESVVSASADPDTIVFERDIYNAMELKSVSIGGKNSMTVMSDENGIRDSFVDENKKKKCSVSVKNAQFLAEISTKIEEAYGCPVDLEWAIKEDQIFILQARPITTLDKESEFEMFHEVDAPLRSEEEYLTRANTAEIISGPVSYFCLSYIVTMTKPMIKNYFEEVSRWVFMAEEYLPSWCAYVSNYLFVNIPSFVLRFHQNGTKSIASESSMISGFGRLLDDQHMLDQADRRAKYYPQFSSKKMMFFNLKNLLLVNWRLNKLKSVLSKLKIDLSNSKSAKHMYIKALKQYVQFKEPSIRHMDATVLSSLANTAVMAVFVSATGGKWTTEIFNDIALVLGHNKNEVESATVPASMQELSVAISKAIDVNEFKRMTRKSALGWLKSTKTDAGLKYEKFIKTHGHRGLNEFDVYRKMWEQNELPLVETLQNMVGSSFEDKTKAYMSTKDTIKALTVPLTFLNKLLLRILIPISRRQVAGREMSKSLYIYFLNKFRIACWAVAEQMVAEGRLPDEELYFFLTSHEIFELFETRNPKLIQKAIRRKEFFPKMETLEFQLITKGYPIPVNIEEDDVPMEASFTLKGTPVSQGYIKGTARVAVTLQEAKSIKKGEILIAKGTDIGWSPYFPMLSGVVTELGGLVSHGAVVAREYGLPCVVGVLGATRKIKSGDLIILDANKGTVNKIKI